MKKIMFVVVVVALVGAVAFAAAPAKGGKVSQPASAGSPSQGRAAIALDYWGAGGTGFYYWTGAMYMSNLFKPTGATYPLDVVSLDVMAASLDDSTTTGAAGVLNGVAVFDMAGTVLARELNVAAQVLTWKNVPLTTVPRINAGNFYGAIWNSAVGATDRNDGGQQTTASNWVAPPTEPLECLGTAGAAETAAAAGPWVGNGCGGSYSTVSAASVIANINDGVPVELMRFDVE